MSLQSMSCFNLCLKKWFRHSSKNASSANPFKPFTTWESRLAYKICTDNKDGKVFERLRILHDAAKNELQQTQLRVTQQAQLWTLLSAVLWRCRDVALQLENNPIMNCTHEDPLIHWDEESIKNLLAIFPTVSMQLLDAYNSFLCALCAWKPHYFKLLCQWGGLEGVTLSPNNPTLLHKIVDSFPFVALSALSKDNVKSLLQSEILETICESLTCFCLAQFPFIRKELSIVSHPLFSCGMCSKESKRLQEMADSFSPNENSIALFCSPATLTCALKLLNNLCDIALMNTSIKHYLGVNERCFSLWVPLFIMTLLNDEFEALTYEPLAHLQIETIVEKYFSILCSGSQQNQIKFSLLLTAVLDAALNKKIWTKIPDFIRKIMLEIIMKKPTVEVILHCEDSPVPLLADGYMHTPSTVSTQSDLFSIKQTSLFQQHPANRLNACHGQTVSLQVPSDVTVFSILKNFNIPRWTTYMEYTQLSQKFGGTDAANPPPPLMIAIQTRQGDLALVTPNVSLNTLLLSTNLSSQLPSMSEESNNTVCDSVIHLYLIGTSPNFAENCTLPHLQFPLDVASGRMEDISPLHNMTSVGGLQSLSFALPLLYPKLQSLLLKSKKEKDCSKALLLSNMDEMHNSADIDISNDLLVSLKSNLSNLTSQLLSATSFLGLPTTNMPTVVPSQVATSSSLKAMQQPVVPYGPIHVSSIPQNMVSLQRRKHAPAVKNISLPELLIYSPVSFALFLQLPMFGKFMLNYNLDASRQMLRLLLGDSSITTSFATVNSSNSPGPSSTLKSNESAVDKDCLAIAEENNEKLTIFPFTVLQHLMNQYGLDSKLGQDIREKAAENGALSLCLRCLAVFSSQQRSQSRQQSLHHWSDDVESLIESVLLDVQLQLDLGMIDKQKTPAANNMGNLSMLDNDLVNIDIIPTMSDGVSYEEDKHYWAKGTGFGTGNVYSSWDAEDALKRQSLQEKQCAGLMDVLACILYPSYADEKKINTFLQQKDDFSPDMTCCIRSKLVVELYEQSSILSILEAYLRNDSVLDVSTRVPLYQSIIHLLCSIALSPSLCYLLNVTLVTHDVETNLPPNLIGLLEQMNNCVSTYMHRLKKIPAPSQEDRFKRKKALTRQPSIHRGFTRGGLSSRSRAGIQKEYFNNATEPSDSGLAKLAPQLVRTQQILACLKDYFERQSLLEFERLRIQQAESGNAVVENSSQSFPASASCVVAVNKDKQYCDTMKPEQFGFFRMLRVNDDGSVVFLVKHGYANQIRQNMGSSKQMPANSSKTASGNLHSSMPPPVTSNNVVSGQWLSFLPQGNPFVKVGPAGSIFGKKNDTSSVSTQVDGEHARRLAQETVTLSTSLPLSASSSVFVRCDEERLDLMKALIVGPSDTPYANGLFEFDIYFPPTYPKSPPGITLVTTGNSTVRFNPNLYNDGKVCLSILNTWHGRPEEKWNPKTSTLLQVLVSIQSLIMVPEPYFNEPGYERTRGTSIGNQASLDYDANIRQATVKWAMLEMLRNPPPAFAKVCQEHFRLKRDEIRKQLEDWISSRPPKTDKQKTGHVNQTSHALLVRHTADLLTEMNNKYAHNQSSAEDIATTSSSTVVAKESAAKSNDSVSDNSPENDPLL